MNVRTRSTMSRFRAGDLVEVRTADEILRTLDERGTCDGLPFMPEMLRYCGKRFRVSKAAHKTCDTIHYSGIRRLPTSVHLENLRCDGSAHGGCEAACLLFWKDNWLKPAGSNEEPSTAVGSRTIACCTYESLQENTRRADISSSDIRYVCQITNLLKATRPWAWWNPSQYVADVRSRNFPLGHVLRILTRAALSRMIRSFPSQTGLRRLYDRLARNWGMAPFLSRDMLVGTCDTTSSVSPDEAPPKPGDWVRVRTRDEIIATLSRSGRNRGMTFDIEMTAFCGSAFRVRSEVSKIIDEGSGRMLEMRNPCLTLEGAACRSEYSEQRHLCPRGILHYWRPIWLQKLPNPSQKPEVDGA